MVQSTKDALNSNPAAAAAPGGWAKALVGGAIDALGGGKSAPAAAGQGVQPAAQAAPAKAGGLRGALGTLAHVGEAVGDVAGNIATGGTLGAVQGGIAKEKQQKMVQMETLMRVAANTRAVYKANEADQIESYANNKKFTDAQEADGFQRMPGLISQTKLNDMVAKDPHFFDKWTGRPTDREPVLDGKGNPVLDKATKMQVYSPMYTVISRTPPVGGTEGQHLVTAEESADYKKLGKDIPENTKLPQVYHDSLDAQVESRRIFDRQVNKGRAEDMSAAQAKQVNDAYNGSPTILAYATKYPSALQGLFEAQSNGEAHIASVDQQIAAVQKAAPARPGQPNPVLDKLQQQRQKMADEHSKISFIIEHGFDEKQRDDYAKTQYNGLTELRDLTKEADKAHGDDAASMAVTFQAKADDPNTPPTLKNIYLNKATQLRKQAQASIDFAANKKTQETNAENQANTGDFSGIMDMVKNYDYDPDKLFSRFKDLKAKRDFMAQIYKETGETWNDRTYKQRYATAQDFRPEGKGGEAKTSLNTFAEHVGDANSLIATLNNTRSPLLNTPLNKMKENVLGSPQFVQYQVAIGAAAENYINFLLNNKAKHQSDDELVAKLESTNTSPAMAQGMMRQMATTIALRAREFNKTYKDVMKTDIPGLLDADTKQILSSFGVDPNSITKEGPSGLVAPTLPPAALSQLKEGQHTTFGNGQTWTLEGGKPVQVNPQAAPASSDPFAAYGGKKL
jgi:hypothetical protein